MNKDSVKILAHTIRVMLVDDHQTMLWGLTKLIESERPRMDVVGTAATGDEALTQIGLLQPDVILLDIDLGGTSTIQIIPDLLANARSKILVFTGSRDQKMLDLAILNGARGVLCKDASAEHVIKAIEKIAAGEIWLDRQTLGRVFSEFVTSKAPPPQNSALGKYSNLTAKEQKVVADVVKGSGASNAVLAERLFISEHTLRNHLTSVYHKLGVTNRLELYVYAVKHELAK